MLLGRLSRVAQRTSSLCFTRTVRPVSWGIVRQYSAHAQQQVQLQTEQEPLTPLDFIPDEVFNNYKLPRSEQNLALIRVLEIVREAEALITNNDEFERAEAMLTGALDFIAKNNINDSWVIGSAHANLAYVLQQRNKYDAAMSNYGIGLQNLSKEPVKDPRFVGLRQLGFAELLSLQGEHAMAATTCQSAIAQLERALQDKDALVGIASSNLAAYRLLEGKPNQAISFAERGLRILETTLGKHNDVTRNCAVNLSKIYKALGKTADVESLDSRFLEDDQPILAAQTGNYAPEYLQSLKNKWRKQGPRKIFDPPGLHRSSSLSANSYNAFVKAWKSKGLPITSAAAGVLASEFKSLSYSHDQLKKHIGRPLPKEFRDAPEKYKTGFEKLKLKGITSLANQLDKDASLPPLLPEDVVITEQEWKDAAERQRSYRAAHGDPMFEAAQDEFSRSEEFFEGVEEAGGKKKKKSALEEDYDEEEDLPENQQVEEGKELADKEETDNEVSQYGGEDAILRRLAMQSEDDELYEDDWDKDEYDAYEAVHGTPEEREAQAEASHNWCMGHEDEFKEFNETDNLPVEESSDEELAELLLQLEGGHVQTPEEIAQLFDAYGLNHGLAITKEEGDARKKLRPAYENPHFVTSRADYLAGEGLPNVYQVLEAEEGDVEGEENAEENKEAEVKESEGKEPKVYKRVAFRMRAELSEVNEIANDEEADNYDAEEQALRIEEELAVRKYSNKLRKDIAEGKPTTPEMEHQEKLDQFEKVYSEEVQQIVQRIKNEIARRSKTNEELRIKHKMGLNNDPYDFNPDEDEVFDYEEHKKPELADKELKRLQEEAVREQEKGQRRKPKYGRLHETAWHDDFEST